MTFSSVEIIGYVASLFVLVSFLMKDIKKLRLINSVGCMLFVIYGILLNFSIPIILTNTAILIINAIALLKKPS
jgi:uncharacterized protein with PQ loop repeat